MTADPLIASALLGTARMSAMPPSPDPALDATWSAISTENPASAVLQGLALLRAFRRAGAKTAEIMDDADGCPAETCPLLPVAAVDLAMRLLAGEFPEVLPEWLEFATASGRVLPARLIPDVLLAAAKNEALRQVAPALVGERGAWLARRHAEFSWLLESTSVAESAWDTGSSPERLAWLRQTRSTDPLRAATAVSARWPEEDATMREGILRIVAESPHPCDESCLETHALKDRRQEIRERAMVCLLGLPESAFRSRAKSRARQLVKIERRLLRRVVTIEPPAAFAPEWAGDGIKEPPPQATGEKAWWLRQIVSLVPLDDWPALLDCPPADLFSLPVHGDWKDPLILGWIEAAGRSPKHCLAEHFIPFLGKLDPWPVGCAGRENQIAGLLGFLPIAARYKLLDGLVSVVSPMAMLDLLARCKQAPPAGVGMISLRAIDAALPVHFRSLTRPQARALALCIPAGEIQARLQLISQLPDVSSPVEEFATTLEFRKSLISQFQIP